jgi:tetratricopeptide (TPR) repeat protein
MVEIAKKRNDSINLARAYNHIGESYKRGINIDSAFYYYSRALKIYQKKKNNLEVGKLNLRIAKEKYFYRDYFGSEKSAVIAFGYLRLEENIQSIFQTYTLLGLNCVMTKDYFKAQDYFLKAYNQITSNTEQKFTELQLKAGAINNLAYINIQLNNFEKAITLIEEGLKEPNLRVEHPELYAVFVLNRGIVNF